MKYRYGKLTKYRLLAGSPELRAVLPETRALNRKAFAELLDRFGTVIVKPSGSSGGSGVMQVSRQGKGKYELHEGAAKRRFTGLDAVFDAVRKRIGGRYPIVQRKISLARVDGRPFDVRVMVQRKKGGPWTVTGTLAKVAGPGFIVTNVARSRGKVLPLSSAIRRSSVGQASVSRLERRIERISLLAVRRLDRFYPIRTVGMDIGVDRAGRVWIIEANFAPARSLFRRLPDRAMYRRILSCR